MYLKPGNLLQSFCIVLPYRFIALKEKFAFLELGVFSSALLSSQYKMKSSCYSFTCKLRVVFQAMTLIFLLAPVTKCWGKTRRLPPSPRSFQICLDASHFFYLCVLVYCRQVFKQFTDGAVQVCAFIECSVLSLRFFCHRGQNLSFAIKTTATTIGKTFMRHINRQVLSL